MPSAPPGVSAQSREKLKAFSFVGTTDLDDENKENATNFGIGEKIESIKSSTFPLPPRESVLPESTFPSTPAPRIPLADLIGNTEDAYNCAPAAGTPNDHVLWQPGPRSSQSSSYYSTQRGKKRPRSSSPGSSQVERLNHLSASKEPLDLENLQKSLRTPQNDPATDLWNRYANGMSKTLKGDAAFAHLMPSSPQTPSTASSKDSGLRRTASCGIEWPTSKAKRRRVDNGETYNKARNIFAASKTKILAPDLPKNSRVGLLVEKIQESLARRPVEQSNGPSSSSPLPDRNRDVEVLSPFAERRSEICNDAHDFSHDPELASPSKVAGNGIQQQQYSASSSEFGDDDIDMAFLETIEMAATQQLQKQQALSAQTARAPDKEAEKSQSAQPSLRAAPDHDEMSRGAPVGNHNSHCRSGHAAKENMVLDGLYDDNFSDNDDTFTDELRGLVDQVDSQQRPPLFVNPVSETVPSHTASRAQTIGPPTDGGFDDPFDDDDELWNEVDETTVVEQGPSVGSTSQRRSDNRAIKRYLIVDVVDTLYETSQGRKLPEKMLSVKDEKTRMLKIILLRQSWYDSRCTKGSYVHLIGEFDRTGQCIVDDADNMIVLHPDHLISATVVADSFQCTRRATLQDRVKATSVADNSQVYGHILHEIFGHALTANTFSNHELREIIEKILPNYIESLYEINVEVPEALDYLMGKMPELKAWASVFVSAKPVPDAVIRDRNDSVAWMAINKLLAVEEHIWSPMYGLKGNVDATVQVAMTAPGDDLAQTLTVPFELKTGKRDSSDAHRAQTALYTLLLSDRYDINVTCGILYYLETSKTFRIQGIRNEIRHMIIQRNELACYVHDKLDLPPMIQREHLCKRCYAQTPCFTYHKLVEGGDGKSSGVGDVFDQAVGHLKPQHQAFFKKWDELLTKEERDTMKFRRELWTMLSHEREALGRCFGKVVIEPGSASEDTQVSRINRYQYAFVKQNASPGFSFTESQLTTGEPIVISDEKGHFALANGFVTKVRPTRINVAVDRRLHDVRRRSRHFHPVSNQVFTGIMKVASGSSPTPQPSDPNNPVLYRIDKDEFSNGMATARNNIIRIMEKELFRARELRQLIIENKPPTFKPVATAYALSGPASQQNLNMDQRRAIDKVMSAKDYALVLGMPGTGKTTTIAHIIRALVSQNKSVLLTSYTHTAVDNILLKIKHDGIPVLRLGSVGRIHPEVKDFADLGGIPKKSIAELENSYVNSKVVATTCLGINERIFNARIFDYCIVDEASQITLPVCLGPIRMARTFILVGDHFQLPPLVQNKEAQQGGLDVSLFKLLSDARPEAVVNLEHQYRMAEDIMLLSNELVYEGRLKCGTQGVAERSLDIPNLENGLAAHHHNPGSVARVATPSDICVLSSSCWLRRALAPQSRCRFLDTDKMGKMAHESISGGSRITNATEATLTAQIVTVLIRSGVSPRSIGVITFYRSQLALLRQEVKAIAGTAAAAELEMHTADRFQGRDKEVVILSCVRNNEANSIGELLKDWRRVNVAVTRAKSKLLMLGSRSTLAKSQNETLEGLVKIMDRKGWVLELPGNALENHTFEGATQATGIMKGGSQSLQRTSPMKKNGIFRKPAKVIQGGIGIVQMEKMLDSRPVMRDIVNEVLD